MRKIYSVIIAVLLVLLFINTAHADVENDLTMRVEAGFQKEAQVGSWVPITVYLENNGEKNLKGQVILKQAQRLPVSYTRSVVIAAGAKKKLDFFIPLGRNIPTTTSGVASNNGTTAVFQSNAGELVEEVELFITSPNTVNIAAVARQNSLNYLNGINLIDPGKTQVAYMMPDQIYSYSQVLGNFKVIVINDADTSVFKGEQLSALKHWLTKGGTLILGGGPNWRNVMSGMPQEWLPVEPLETVMLTQLSSLAVYGDENPAVNQPIPAAKGNLRTDARVLASEGGVPLLAAKDVGRGTVIFSSLDLALEPLLSWRGSGKMWQEILKAGVSVPVSAKGRAMSMGSADVNSSIFRALQQLSALELPGVMLVLAVMVLYLLLIGVVNYWVLRRLDRRDWAWVTIPLLVVFFTSGIYLVGSKGRGDVISSNVSVIALEDNNTAWGQFYTGVFAPSRADYNISVSDTVLPLIEGPGYYGPGEGRTTAVSWQQGKTTVSFEHMPIWSMRSMMYEQPLNINGGIDSQLAISGGNIEGTVTNNTDETFTEAVLFTAQADVVKLGKLAPGQTVKVKITTSPFSGQRGPAISYELADKIWAFGRTQNSKAGQYRMILDGMFGYEGSLEPSGLNFLSWNESPLHEVEINGAVPEQRKDLNMYYAPVSFDLVSQDYSLPAGLVNGEMYATEGNNIDVNPDGVHFQAGSVYYRLNLPQAISAGAEKAVLYLQGEPGLTVSVYNAQSEKWEEHGLKGTEIILEDIKPYLSNGQVKVKITNSSKNHSFFQGMTISIDGVDK